MRLYDIFFDAFDKQVDLLVHGIALISDESLVVEDGDIVLLFESIDIRMAESDDAFEVDRWDGDVRFDDAHFVFNRFHCVRHRVDDFGEDRDLLLVSECRQFGVFHEEIMRDFLAVIPECADAQFFEEREIRAEQVHLEFIQFDYSFFRDIAPSSIGFTVCCHSS